MYEQYELAPIRFSTKARTRGKLRRRSYECLIEALRRFSRFGSRQGDNLTLAWTGLGYPSEYKDAVDQGLMVFISRNHKRCMNWLTLTEQGAAIVRAWLDSGWTHQAVEESGGLPPYDVANTIFLGGKQ